MDWGVTSGYVFYSFVTFEDSYTMCKTSKKFTTKQLAPYRLLIVQLTSYRLFNGRLALSRIQRAVRALVHM
jgi:hypothetical protein